MKKCPNCETEKPTSEFHKDKSRNDGLCCWCKDCKKDLSKCYYENNKDEIKKKCRKWKQENPEKVKKHRQKWKEENPEKQRKIWRDYYDRNPSQKISKNLQSRLWFVLKEEQKSDSILNLLGLSIKEFKEYLKKQFYDDMSWDNYGTYWHVDHIIPCSYYDQTKDSQRQECWFYTNLQPLKAKENLMKHDSI